MKLNCWGMKSGIVWSSEMESENIQIVGIVLL